MGYYRTDSGALFKPGATPKSTKTNPKLQLRPEVGRAPNFRIGAASTQQSVMPPSRGMFGGRMAGLFTNPVTYVRGLFAPAAISTSGAQTLGMVLAEKVAQSAGRPGAANMTLLGGDAPVRRTLFNSDVSDEVIEANIGRTQTDRLMGKPIITQADLDENKPTPDQLKSIYHHPNLPGPAGNRVGTDADTSTPGMQGSGAVPEMAGMDKEDQQMFQWARNFEDLAKKVKPGQSGYAVIQQALGKAPTEMKDIDFSSEDAAAFGMPKPEQVIRQSGGFTEWNTDMDVDAPANVEKSAQEFLKDRINSGFYAASSEQQPNFDGSNDTIGKDSEPISLEVQDFDNANKNPKEVVGDLKDPLGNNISSAPYSSNAGQAAYQFKFNPAKNLFA